MLGKCVGDMLGMRWGNVGDASGIGCRHVGIVCWICRIGNMFETCCGYDGDMSDIVWGQFRERVRCGQEHLSM